MIDHDDAKKRRHHTELIKDFLERSFPDWTVDNHDAELCVTFRVYPKPSDPTPFHLLHVDEEILVDSRDDAEILEALNLGETVKKLQSGVRTEVRVGYSIEDEISIELLGGK